MQTSEFDFTFPENQIAMHPLPRGKARLMVLSKTGSLPADFPLPIEPEGWAFGEVGDLIRILKPGDALALNDTRVLKARLQGVLENGAGCEVLLLKPRATGSKPGSIWECLAKPGRKLAPGRQVKFSPTLTAGVIEVMPEGERVLEFNLGGDALLQELENIGDIPLPPYIRRHTEEKDVESYQSVFAEKPGSVAAPTASLHLTNELLENAVHNGVTIAKLTLHIGAGTFRPVQTERIEDHPMHSETYSLSAESAAILNAARSGGGRIFAVGTTAARVLETCGDETGALHAGSGETRLFVTPGYSWKSVDALLTNLHWPQSTLFMLVCGMIGLERAKAAYAEAIGRGFRLFSYGDAMLIL